MATKWKIHSILYWMNLVVQLKDNDTNKVNTQHGIVERDPKSQLDPKSLGAAKLRISHVPLHIDICSGRGKLSQGECQRVENVRWNSSPKWDDPWWLICYSSSIVQRAQILKRRTPQPKESHWPCSKCFVRAVGWCQRRVNEGPQNHWCAILVFENYLVDKLTTTTTTTLSRTDAVLCSYPCWSKIHSVPDLDK